MLKVCLREQSADSNNVGLMSIMLGSQDSKLPKHSQAKAKQDIHDI
jgi:hypothetical protein